MRVALHLLLFVTAYVAGALLTVSCLVLFVASVATVFLAPERVAVLHWVALLIGMPAAIVPGLLVVQLQKLLMRVLVEEGNKS